MTLFLNPRYNVARQRSYAASKSRFSRFSNVLKSAWAWFARGAWFAVTPRFCSARLCRLAMATTADRSTKERLLSALADLEVLSR